MDRLGEIPFWTMEQDSVLSLLEDVESYSPGPDFAAWTISIYVFGGGHTPEHHKNYETQLSKHPWKYHLQTGPGISSMARCGVSYQTDDLIEGLTVIRNYLEAHKKDIADWGVSKEVDLGNPEWK